MKKSLQLIFFNSFILFAFALSGQTIRPIEPAVPPTAQFNGQLPIIKNNTSVAVAPTRTGANSELTALLQHTLDSLQEQLSLIGIGAAIRMPDGDIWSSGSGISHEVPAVDSINENHRFAWGSITKTITAACILQLYEEGMLDLEDTVGMHLPPLPNINPSVTIRQLLNHTSGTFDYTSNPALFDMVFGDISKVWTVPEIIDSLVLGQSFEPGTNWDYSNTGYLLLGAIIESVTGNIYHEEIRARFIEPLEMTTTFYPPHEQWQQPTAHLWTDFDGDNIVIDDNDLFQNFSGLYSIAGAAGSYFSTPIDLANWIYELQAGDLLAEATKAEMRDFVPTANYGLGTMQLNFGNSVGWGHGGDIFYSAGAFYFPDCGVTIAVQVNDQRFPSVALNAPIGALLQTYKEYLMTPTEEFFSAFDFAIAPNPFQNELQIQYELSEAARVEISVFDAYGRLIQQNNYEAQVGVQNWIWDGKSRQGIEIPNGIYWVNFSIDGHSFSKMILKQ